MNKILLILISTFFIIPFASAHHSDVTKVKAKDHTCQQLQDIVQEEEVVHIKGFGSLNVYAESVHACSHENCSIDRCETFKSYWPTSDKHFCFAGYACRATPDK